MIRTGSELKAYRERCGVSQADVAQALDVSQSLLSLWESGYRPVPPEKVGTYVDFVAKKADERAAIARSERP